MRKLLICLGLFTFAGVLAGPAAAGSTAPDADALDEVTAFDETISKFDDPGGGNAAADDPAIWLHPTASEQSVILGTLKEGGLDAYDIEGRLLQHIPVPGPPEEGLRGGNFNNVDLVQGASASGLPSDFAVVSDRGRDRLRIYRIDPAGAEAGDAVLTDVTSPDAPPVFSADEEAVEEQLTAYGLAVRLTDDGGVQAVATQRNTTSLRLLELRGVAGGLVTYDLLDQARVPAKFELPDGTTWRPCTEPGEGPKLEGMVIDARTGVLFAAQEEVGIWRMPLTADAFDGRKLKERVLEYGRDAVWNEETEQCDVVGSDPGIGGKHISAQVEGLSIAYALGGGSTMVVSSQGDSTFSLFRLGDGERWDWYRRFEVVESLITDAVTDCDGAAVVTTAVGPNYPKGLLVVQDAPNRQPGPDQARQNTNFKLIRWDEARH